MNTFDNFLLPVKPEYVLLFNNNLRRYITQDTCFYTPYMEYVFEYLEDLLLANRFITVVAVMRNNPRAYVSDLVNELYISALQDADSRISDLDDGISNSSSADYNDALAYYEYLLTHEEAITSNFYYIIYFLIIDVFHVLYQLDIEASKMGISFSTFRLSGAASSNTLRVTAVPAMEVIKKYDKYYYDRLCVFATV